LVFLKFLKKFLGFSAEDRTQNYDPTQAGKTFYTHHKNVTLSGRQGVKNRN